MTADEEREFFEDAESIYQEAKEDPVTTGAMPPPEMREMLLKDIRKHEEDRALQNLSEENKRLLELGRIYQRKQKNRKYFVLVAMVVFVCAFGITGIGGTEHVFSSINSIIGNRNQELVDSQNTKPNVYVDEEEAYAKIEKEFGFLPVRMTYLPKSTEFQEATIGDKFQGIYMIYGTKNKTDMIYMIRPNYRESSWGKDIEDEFLEEYEIEISGVMIHVKKYEVEEEIIRWLALFEYHDVNYSIACSEIEKEMLESIIQNLYFPE